MTRYKMCNNGGLIGGTSPLKGGAFNSDIVKPIRRALCCGANSDVSSSDTRSVKIARNRIEAKEVRDSIEVHPKVAAAYNKTFNPSRLSIGENNIKAIRAPPLVRIPIVEEYNNSSENSVEKRPPSEIKKIIDQRKNFTRSVSAPSVLATFSRDSGKNRKKGSSDGKASSRKKGSSGRKASAGRKASFSRKA